MVGAVNGFATSQRIAEIGVQNWKHDSKVLIRQQPAKMRSKTHSELIGAP